jgi:hypothetical protein
MIAGRIGRMNRQARQDRPAIGEPQARPEAGRRRPPVDGAAGDGRGGDKGL